MASLERTQRRKQVLFPQKLWEILEDPRWAEWISWHDNGRSVMIQSRQAFAENVMLVYWVSQQRKPSAESASSKPAWEKAWNSFDRQLRNYNFKKLDTVNMIVFAHENFVQGQKDKMLAMRAAWTSALDDDFDFDADDAIEEDEEAPAVVETAAAKRRRLSGPPETRAEAERLQARLNNVNTALEAVEASVFCAEQRLAALQAENRALWGHYADAAAAVSGSECHIREGDFDAAAALQGITAAMAEAEEAAQAAEAAEAAEATTEATAEAAEATAKASPAVSSAASSSVNTEAANGTLATPLGSPSISHV